MENIFTGEIADSKQTIALPKNNEEENCNRRKRIF